MDEALTRLIAASIAFLGTHFALSHPLRAPLVRALGAMGFQALYSLVALATFGWMVWEFRAVSPDGGAVLWNGSGPALWIIASLLTLIAAVLFLGSFASNPALPDPRAAANAAKPVHGAFHVTRHPMMWGFALWAVSHMLVSPTPRSLVLAGTILILALVGAHLQDRKKASLMGAAWVQWAARTSYWPNLAGLAQVGAVLWLAGTALWLAATWAHIPISYIPAGVWRLIG